MAEGQFYDEVEKVLFTTFSSLPPAAVLPMLATTQSSASNIAVISDDLDTIARRERVRLIQICIGIFLLIVGTVGNILAFVVLRQKALRIHATAFLLSMLAICDMVCLYLGLLNKIVEYFARYDVFRTSISILCPIQVFLLYGSLQYASWLLVLVAAERFFSVWFPLRSRSVCTVRNAKIAAAVVLLIQAALNSHLLFTTAVIKPAKADPERIHQQKPLVGNVSSSMPSVAKINSSQLTNNATIDDDAQQPLATEQSREDLVCDAKSDYEYFLNKIWPLIDLTIFCFIPFTIMLILNVLIAWRILSLRRNSTASVSLASTGRRLSGMTAIMFACSFSFFALTLPISVYMVARSKMSDQEPQNRFLMYVIWTVTNLMQYASNSVNFFLYCLSGSLFRRELIKLFQSWFLVLKSLFCCWYCCPQKIPNAYGDYAEADIGARFPKTNNGGDRLKLVGVGATVQQKGKKVRKNLSFLGCINDNHDEIADDGGDENNNHKPKDNDVYSPVVIGEIANNEQQPFILQQQQQQNRSSNRSSDNNLLLRQSPNNASMKRADSERNTSPKSKTKTGDIDDDVIHFKSSPLSDDVESPAGEQYEQISALSSEERNGKKKKKEKKLQFSFTNNNKSKTPKSSKNRVQYRSDAFILSTLFDSEATSATAYAVTAMITLDEAEETAADDSSTPKEQSETPLIPSTTAPPPSTTTRLGEEASLSYAPQRSQLMMGRTRNRHDMFQEFGPMC